MASLGSLVIELAANTARLQGDLGRAVTMAERGAQKMGSAFKVLAAGGISVGLTSLVKQSIQFGDELNKAAIKAGISGRAISELAFAAKQSDVELGALSNSLRFMQTNLSEASSGAKAPIAALRALGLEFKDIAGLAADRQFEVIGEQISRLKDPADRARAATEIFGRAGADLLPLFEQGAKGIREARAEAERLGQSFSSEQLKALAAADDSVKRLTSSFSAMATTLTAKVAPSLSQFLDNMTAIFTGDQIGKLRENIDFLERMKGRSFISVDYGEIGTGFFTAAEGAEKLLELQTKLAALTAQAGRASPGTPAGAAPAGYGAPSATPTSDIVLLTTKQVSALKAEIASLTIGTRSFLDVIAADGQSFESTRFDQFGAALEELVPLTSQITDSIAAANTEISSMSVFADQASRNMQNAFAEFLFDPFHSGLDGMLKGFVDTMRRMIAEAMAAEIIKSLLGLGGGMGGGMGGFFGSLLGFANGGSFNVGGSGGTDSQLVAFRATPGERVTVTTPAQQKGGRSSIVVHQSVTNNINASQLTQDQAARLVADSQRRMWDDLDRRYGIA